MTDSDHAEIETTFVPVGRRSAQVIELDGQGLLFDNDLRTWMVLNPTALVIWRCLDGTGTVTEIADDMSTAFGTEQEVVRMHVLQVVRAFGRQGLLEGVAPLNGHHGHDENEEEAGAGQTRQDEPLFLHVPPTT